jgi:hypothetical protein
MRVKFNVAHCVQTALKAKSPIVGIPLPGEPPFCLRRQFLADSLRGLKVIDAAIQLPLDSKGTKVLVVYAAGPRVQAVRKYLPMQSWSPDHIRIPLSNWAEAHKKKMSSPKLSVYNKQLVRLQKKLTKLGAPRAPQHPLLYKDHWRKSVQEYDERERKAWISLVEDGCDVQPPLTLGQTWAQFKREAPMRQWIQNQARECSKGKISTTQLYARLRDRGLKVRKWSELSTYERDKCGGELFKYLGRLWQFCNCSGKPTYWFDQPDHYYKPGSGHYQSWLEHLHEYKELQSMIAGVEELKEAAAA